MTEEQAGLDQFDTVEQDETPGGEEPELEAKGIQSTVQVNGERDGHILLIDWDDWTPGEREQKYIEDLPGITFLTESSEGSYHCWNLTIRGLDETALELLKVKSDPMRTVVGYRWRPPRWVTRLSPKKWKSDGTVYKDAPRLVSMRYNPTTLPQSKGHWVMARAFIEGFPEEPPEGAVMRDTGTVVDEYEAYTDEQKRRWHDE